MIKGPQPTIADSIDTFIRAKESEGISPRRVKKLRLQLDQFEEFMSGPVEAVSVPVLRTPDIRDDVGLFLRFDFGGQCEVKAGAARRVGRGREPASVRFHN